jgi:uncharacterized protein DUF1707
MRFSSGAERPVSALPAIFAHETGAPRPAQPQPQHAVLRPAAVPVRAAAQARRRGTVRVSRADREQVLELLEDAFAEDRLTKDQLTARAGQAYASRTDEQLAALTADLPAGAYPAAGPGRQHRRPDPFIEPSASPAVPLPVIATSAVTPPAP